jgi:HK97 family phage major capsid protein
VNKEKVFSAYRQIAALKKQGRTLASSADSSGCLSAQQRQQFETILSNISSLSAEIKREQGFNAREIESIEAGPTPRHSYKPFASLGEQLLAIRQATMNPMGGADARLYAAALGNNETVPAEGGFLVEPEFAADILQRTYDVGLVSSRCYEFPITKNRLIVPAVDEDSRKDGSRWGGVLAYWGPEAASYQGMRPKFRNMEVIANKLTGLVFLTEEITEDSAALGAYVGDAFPKEFSFQVDTAIFNGSGAGQPLGINNCGALVTVAKDSNQAAATITTSNILNMWSRMWAPSRATSCWFINQNIESQLYPLTLGSPSLGQILLYTPPGANGNTSGYGLLFGRPVIPIEQASTLGTQGDIMLCDMQQYLLAKKVGGIRADTSIHVAFLTGEQAFRFMLRLDGQPMWKKPLTPYNGTNTLSAFVALASR